MGDRSTSQESHAGPNNAFAALADYIALPRISGLAISADGQALATSVSTPSADGKKYVSALWQLDASGAAPARRLTRSGPGESSPVFLPDGGLLFTSKRADPEVTEPDQDHAALWLLPAGGGEARQVASRPQGIDSVAVATESGDIFFTAAVTPGSIDAADDERRFKARKDAGVSAILHESYPIRYWDHDLGATQTHVFAGGKLAGRPTEPGSDSDRLDEPRDLTIDPGGRITGLTANATGTAIAYVVQRRSGPAAERSIVVVRHATTGDVLLTIEANDADFDQPRFSPDGVSLVCVRGQAGTYDEAPRCTLWQVSLETGEGHDPAPSFPQWPGSPRFASDGGSIFFVADEQGHSPVFRLDLGDGSVTRLTATGSHTDIVLAADGKTLYALRSSYREPPTPIALDTVTANQDGGTVPSPADIGVLPGTLTEVSTQADDGVPLRAWLALPEGASPSTPAPLLLWIHGGPLGSWNAWSWRWNPWLMVARGYAVLLPDPALSTGYGQDFIRRGWGDWGARPFTDLMAATDAACARADIDDFRTAAMGGSFGGYMANWVATHTNRFKAIVTHASLWHLEGFSGTTDAAWYWQEEFGDPLKSLDRYNANSPHLYVGNITTPMLVIHGDKDYRVPIGEGLRLWYDLVRHSVEAKFLYFPDENHWVLTPGHAQVWYETVLAFLEQHVLDRPWKRPELL
jgi:dipeptidyl aminopeptidase/acylaminoacyl peptidase